MDVLNKAYKSYKYVFERCLKAIISRNVFSSITIVLLCAHCVNMIISSSAAAT